MATPKRQRQPNSASHPANSAGHPTISVRAERTAESLAAERQAMMMQRAKVAGAIGVPIILLLGLLVYFRPFSGPATEAVAPAAPAQATAAPAAAAVQPTAAAIVPPQPTAAPAAAAPIVQPTAAAAAQPQATAVPAAAAPQPATGAVACEAIAGVPVYTGAVCLKHDLDHDNGVIKAENSYSTTANADDLRRFYEGTFAKDGWTVQEFDYDITVGTRRLKIQAESDKGANGPVTKLKLTEYGASAGARTSCVAIDGLPTFANATCSDFDTDVDNGVLKAQNTYITTASAQEVYSFYSGTLQQNNWAGQDFSYEVAQAARVLKIVIDTEVGASGTVTELKIGEK
jgi:hypothetical protein